MGKETKEMLQKIIVNQALILKQLQTNHQAIVGNKAKSVVVKKVAVKKATKNKK